MYKVYKYQIFHGINLIQIPTNSTILSCGEQNDKFFIWAIINMEYESVDQITVCAFETGEELPSNIHLKKFIGRIQYKVSPHIYYELHVFYNLGIPNQ